MKNLFLDHPRSVDESYFEHALFAGRFSISLFGATSSRGFMQKRTIADHRTGETGLPVRSIRVILSMIITPQKAKQQTLIRNENGVPSKV